jgi:hypothetical protein
MTKKNIINFGALLFFVWGVLHIWVGYEGLQQFLNGDIKSIWGMFLGGENGSKNLFVYTDNILTANVHKHLIINFAIDVGGYGVLGMFVSYLLFKQQSWTAYYVGVFVIGIADLAFLFSFVLSGIIELNAGTVGGPVLWFLACIITPFGLLKK